jgi:acyl-CoA dehydrogenase
MKPALLAGLSAAPDIRPVDDVAAWWAFWPSLAAACQRPIDLAIASGFAADRIGWAFAGGYQAALRALDPTLTPDTLSAFCVTEDAGNKPRDIRTTFRTQPDGSLRIDGSKRWTTLGPVSSQMLIVGVMVEGEVLPDAVSDTGTGTGTVTGTDTHIVTPARPRLRVARVPSMTAGLTLHTMPATAFVPEVPHARLTMRQVQITADALLPGDGYDTCVKPFRTLEDLHVTAAVLAYLLLEARSRRWPPAFGESLVASIEGLSNLAAEDPQAAATHLPLAGALHTAHRLYDDAAPLWAAAAEDPAAQRWQRDAALFKVAGSARAQRAARAWQRLGSAG